jgi:hypothetical protein
MLIVVILAEEMQMLQADLESFKKRLTSGARADDLNAELDRFVKRCQKFFSRIKTKQKDQATARNGFYASGATR